MPPDILSSVWDGSRCRRLFWVPFGTAVRRCRLLFLSLHLSAVSSFSVRRVSECVWCFAFGSVTGLIQKGEGEGEGEGDEEGEEEE